MPISIFLTKGYRLITRSTSQSAANNRIFCLASPLNFSLEVFIPILYCKSTSEGDLLIQRLNNCGLGPAGKHELSERLRLPSLSKPACGDTPNVLGIYLANASSHRSCILRDL